jgi:glycosyltransferase involved in cell wall biosynthesis
MATSVSVIIPTWQRHHLLLPRSLESLMTQTVPADEIIVVSDGPDPILRALMTAIPVTYLEVDVHHEGTNFGSYARNFALRHVHTDLIAYLDDDNSLRPRHLECLVDALDRTPSAQFAYSQMFRHTFNDIVGSPIADFGCVDTSILMHRATLQTRWPEPDSEICDWELVKGWLGMGAEYVHIPEITVDYFFRGGE